MGLWILYLTENNRLAQAVAGANTARQALQILTEAGAGQVVAHVGAAMLAALREYAGPGPKLGAVMFDFDGAPLWRGESPGEAAP